MRGEKRFRSFSCPFCGRPLEGPRRLQMRFGFTFGGYCPCGAVFVYDKTGRLLGEAFTDALALLYGEDYEAAYSAQEGVDYEEEVLIWSSSYRGYLSGPLPLERGEKFLFLRKKG
jgi:hypothetical protein